MPIMIISVPAKRMNPIATPLGSSLSWTDDGYCGETWSAI